MLRRRSNNSSSNIARKKITETTTTATIIVREDPLLLSAALAEGLGGRVTGALVSLLESEDGDLEGPVVGGRFLLGRNVGFRTGLLEGANVGVVNPPVIRGPETRNTGTPTATKSDLTKSF